ERGQAALRFVEAIVEHAAKSALARQPIDGTHIEAVDNRGLKGRVNRQQLDDRNAPNIARAVTILTSCGLPKCGRQIRPHARLEPGQFRGCVRDWYSALGTKPPNQALREHSSKSRRQQKWFDSQINQARNGAYGVIRVQSGEDEV